jgi:hypothetical protein
MSRTVVPAEESGTFRFHVPASGRRQAVWMAVWLSIPSISLVLALARRNASDAGTWRTIAVIELVLVAPLLVATAIRYWKAQAGRPWLVIGPTGLEFSSGLRILWQEIESIRLRTGVVRYEFLQPIMTIRSRDGRSRSIYLNPYGSRNDIAAAIRSIAAANSRE